MELSVSRLNPEERIALLADIAENRFPYTELMFDDDDEVDPEFFTALMEALKTNTTVKHLNLEGLGLLSKQMNEVGKMLIANKGIESLDLSHNKIKPSGIHSLARALRHNHTLRQLSVTDHIHLFPLLNTLTPQDNDNSNRSNTTVTTLFIDGHELKINTLKGIRALLSTNTSLTYLDLSGTRIDNHMLFIAEGLINNRTLRTLHLNRSKLSLSAAYCLAQVLKRSTTLETLSLLSCCFEKNDPRLSLLLHAIGENRSSSLRELYLSNNAFNDSLVPMLSRNRSLHRLLLRNAELTRDDLLNLTRALLRNNTLTTLNINDTLDPSNLHYCEPAVVKFVVRTNHALQNFTGTYSQFDDFAQIGQRNRVLAERYRQHVGAVAITSVLIAFMNANLGSPFRDSILAMLRDPSKNSIFAYLNNDYGISIQRRRPVYRLAVGMGMFARTSTSSSRPSTAAEAMNEALAAAAAPSTLDVPNRYGLFHTSTASTANDADEMDDTVIYSDSSADDSIDSYRKMDMS